MEARLMIILLWWLNMDDRVGLLVNIFGRFGMNVLFGLLGHLLVRFKGDCKGIEEVIVGWLQVAFLWSFDLMVILIHYKDAVASAQ